MKLQEFRFWVVLSVGLLSGAECFAQESGADTPEALVQRLPTNGSAFPLDRELTDRIASLGAKALPALEKQLRLGIKFPELNELLGANASRRCAVVQVLARIPGDKSTDLLVRSLASPPDTYGMRVVTLNTLAERKLSDRQILVLLQHNHPDVVLTGISYAVKAGMTPRQMAAIEQVFDPAKAARQFKNEYGAQTASPDGLWNVRLAAANALKKDLTQEKILRAQESLKVLKAESLKPTRPDEPDRMSCFSPAENTILRQLQKLVDLGEPAKTIVQREAETATGDYAKVLDMGLARLGETDRVAKVATHLTDSTNQMIRVCAVMTLRLLRDPSARPALKRALRDPYQREDGSCVRLPNGKVYPVRMVAADALIDLGEDPTEVRARMREP